jgi:hypothetical protein
MLCWHEVTLQREDSAVLQRPALSIAAMTMMDDPDDLQLTAYWLNIEAEL